MPYPVILFLILLTLPLQASEKKRKIYPIEQQSILYEGGMKVTPPEPAPEPGHGFYTALQGRYFSGEHITQTQLSTHIYREDREKITYGDAALTLGYGSMGGDRFEISYLPVMYFDVTDTLSEAEYREGDGIEMAYYFAFDTLYQADNPGNIIPYFKVGFGISRFTIDPQYSSQYSSDTIVANDYLFGLGTLLQLSSSLAFTIAYEVTLRRFQAIENGIYTKETRQELGGLSGGFSYFF